MSDPRQYGVAVVANHDLDPRLIADHLVRRLASLPPNVTVRLRHPIEGEPGRPEQMVAVACEGLGIDAVWVYPIAGTGSTGTIDRDYLLVDRSDLVIAYFREDRIMDESSGTTRVTRIAIDNDKSVEAYAPTTGAMIEVGSISVPA